MARAEERREREKGWFTERRWVLLKIPRGDTDELGRRAVTVMCDPVLVGAKRVKDKKIKLQYTAHHATKHETRT